MNTPKDLPLLFNFAQLVVGVGFVAGVRMKGRAILTHEDGEVWVSGVAPVGWAGGGLSREEALQDFRAGWSAVLLDIAHSAADFAAFEAETRAFLGATLDSTSEEWKAAVTTIRAGGYVDDTLPSIRMEEHVDEFEITQIAGEGMGTGDSSRPALTPEANPSDGGIQQAA